MLLPLHLSALAAGAFNCSDLESQLELRPPERGQEDSWWAAVSACRAALLRRVRYRGTATGDPKQRWTHSAFAIPMVQAYDRTLYDAEAGAYTVQKYLADVRGRYGGVDAVFLWSSYTNMGLDDRNQLDMYRALPGGLAALAAVSDQFRAAGVHVMLAVNPWDTGTRREPGWVSPESDPAMIIPVAVAAGAEGFNMDTMSSTPKDYPERNSSMAFQPEGGGRVLSMEWESMSTCHCKYTAGVQAVDVWKVLDARRMTSVRDRWGATHTDALQHAYFNGVGFETTENDWGEFNRFSMRTAETLRRVNTVLRFLAHAGLLHSPQWRPHVPGCRNAGVFAAHYPSVAVRADSAFLFVSRSPVNRTGVQFALPQAQRDLVAAGASLIDCWQGEALTPSGGEVAFEMPAAGFGCLLVTNNATSGESALARFLRTMRRLAASGALASFDAAYVPLQQVMQRRPRTAEQPASPPQGMVVVPATGPEGFEFTVTSVKDQATAALAADVQFWWEPKGEVVHHAVIPVKRFYMDQTPVTCEQWSDFVEATHYRPQDTHNYLRNWQGGGGAPQLPPDLAGTPVTYVSLREADAYCRHAGKRLPHDWEWQRAAMNRDGDAFPWGPTAASCRAPPGKRCVAPVSISRASPGAPAVGAHSPYGDSRFGVQDM